MDPSENNSGSGEIQYTPTIGEAQLTVRSVVAGCITGSIVACTNIYIGLKIGWSFGASIIAAVLSYALFAIIGRRLSVLETNIAQTAGAAAGGMAGAAGLLNVIPAMQLLDQPLDWATLSLWALSVSFLGVFFAVPLRRQFIEIDKLRFPTGTATAATILAMNSESGDAVAKARALIWSCIGAGAFTLAYYFVPQLENPPLERWLKSAALATAAAWGFKLYFGPSLLGAGFLMGPRVVLSLLLGAILSWGVFGPLARENGWAVGPIMDYKSGARGWILWPGVALMVCEALTALALSWRTFIRALRFRSFGEASDDGDREQIPNSWWIGGLAAGSVVTIVISSTVFDIYWLHTLIAIALSAVLATVAARSLGETDINPTGGVGKVTQLVFGGLSPGQMITNLMSAGITNGGASQAGDMMQDLKTGYLLGASPRKQFGAQLIGVCAGLVLVIPVYRIFTSAYKLGEDQIPAPAAQAWKAMAELLVEGLQALPPHATTALAIAAALCVVLPVLRKIDRIKPYVPSGLAIGIAFIVPAFNSLVMFFGLVVWLIWKRLSPCSVEKYTFAVASGLIAGEGLIGIVNAGLTIANVPRLTK
ncbi:MAG: OPT/YSL family transporter [Pirellulales bacterium]|nr:OPT/YSL family transporter [Pirellulales bacterium]